MSANPFNRRPLPFWASDFLVGSAELTAEEVGVYIRLLAHQWLSGTVPADPAVASALALAPADVVSKVLAAKFEEVPGEPGRCRNARLELARRDVAARSAKARESARARWRGKNATASATASATGDATGMLPSPPPFPNPDTSGEESGPAGDGTKKLTSSQEWVRQIQEVYPRVPAARAAKWSAEFRKLYGDREGQERLIRSLVALMDAGLSTRDVDYIAKCLKTAKQRGGVWSPPSSRRTGGEPPRGGAPARVGAGEPAATVSLPRRKERG